jgi:hypothetical protein
MDNIVETASKVLETKTVRTIEHGLLAAALILAVNHIRRKGFSNAIIALLNVIY